ncbi:MAG: OmpA family protein [Planctomycetes bacterium]|nr:OmpA family protein [Planctomycetota bacterium]
MFKHVFASALCALAFLPLTSCATTKDYNDAISNAKYYQAQLHEAELRLAKTDEENGRLRKRLAENDVKGLSEANSGDLDSRLSDLQSRIDGLGRPLQDIERFDVEGGYLLMVQDKILFESGSADLNADSKKALEHITSEINSKAHGRIWVRGHTDSDPVSKPATKAAFPHGNLQLSAMRAIVVADALAATGNVKQRDLVVAGFGSYDPLHKNDTADNKRLNRRVEIFVSDASSSGADKAVPADAPAPKK